MWCRRHHDITQYFIPGCIILQNSAEGLLKSSRSPPKSPKPMYRGCLLPAGLIIGTCWYQLGCFCATLSSLDHLWEEQQGNKGCQRGILKMPPIQPPARELNKLYSLQLLYENGLAGSEGVEGTEDARRGQGEREILWPYATTQKRLN